MARISLRASWLAASAAAVAAPTWVVAQDGEEGAFDRTPRNCLNIQSIDHTDAIDDQNIIFRMRNDKVYRNHLPSRCPGLERENRFSYKSYNGRLCDLDTITVLEQIGVGLNDGFTCRLGDFVPLSPEEVEDLDLRARAQGRPRRARRGIEARPVETEQVEPAAPAEPVTPAEAAPAAEPAEPQ